MSYSGYKEDWFEHERTTYATLKVVGKLRDQAHFRGFIIGMCVSQLIAIAIFIGIVYIN